MKFNTQLWPYVSGNAKLWGSDSQPAPDAPTIAVVDSGLDSGNPDFGGRDYPQVNLSSLTPTPRATATATARSSPGSLRAARTGYTGASPSSHSSRSG